MAAMGKERYGPAREEQEPNTPGCMSSMLHLLDFHNLLFTTSGRTTPTLASSPPPVKQSSPQLKGVEAPRNSLNIDFETAASSFVIEEEEFFDIPLDIRIIPASSELMEEWRNSQSGTPRTPSLVARLMGLEVLPGLQPSAPPFMVEPQVFNPMTTSKAMKKRAVERQREAPPPPRQPLQQRNNNSLEYPRSLPETPRPSSVRSWESDPRLSLQNNKENNNDHHHYNNSRAMQEFSYLCEVYNSSADCSLPTSPSPRLTKSRRRDCKLGQDENKNPHGSHYTEIVKQAKENISSRRVMSRDERVIRSRRPTRPPEKKHEPMREVKQPPPSQEIDIQKQPLVQKNSRPQLKVKNDRVEAKGVVKVKPNYERCTKRINKKPASSPERVAATQSQLYRLDQKRCMPVPLLVAAKQHNEAPRRSLPPRPVREQVQTNALSTLKCQQRCHQPKDQDPEFRYVRAILEHTGLMLPSDVPHSMKWYSPSLPLNPIIFLKLELNLPRITNSRDHYTTQESRGSLRHRCNRRLLFNLVQEILADILLSTGGGEALLLGLWCKIQSFPAADCRIVGDIDKLVEGDLSEAKVRGLLRHPAVAAEADGVVVEIERSILESLVGEVVMCLGFGRGCRTGGWR